LESYEIEKWVTKYFFILLDAGLLQNLRNQIRAMQERKKVAATRIPESDKAVAESPKFRLGSGSSSPTSSPRCSWCGEGIRPSE
jgi:hypothetical protein